MEIKLALLTLLTNWNTISPQPITTEDVRNSRQASDRECCPCPEINDSDLLSDQYTAPTNTFESSMLDDCPCRGKSWDSMPDSSFFSPALQALRPIIKAVGSKPDQKPLLNPEVGLASSVLETIREATDEEYQDALARDAARNAMQLIKKTELDLPMVESSIDSRGGIINIILNPEDANIDFDVYPEESHIQETRCIHSPLRSTKMIENSISKPSSKLHKQNLIFPDKNILNTNLFDMDNSASNIKEQVNKPDSTLPMRLSTLRNPNWLHMIYNKDNTQINKENKASDESRLATIINNLKKLKQKTDIEMPEEHKDSVNHYDDANIHRDIVLNKNKYLPSLHNLKSVNNNLKPFLFRNSWPPLKVNNLLNLKDVELIPPKKVFVGNEIKNDKDIEINDFHENENCTAINNSHSIAKIASPSKLSDVLPSSSKDNFIATLPYQTNKEPKLTNKESVTQNDYSIKSENIQNVGEHPLIDNITMEKENSLQSNIVSDSNIEQPETAVYDYDDQINSEDPISKEENEAIRPNLINDINDTVDNIEDESNELYSAQTNMSKKFHNVNRNNKEISRKTEPNAQDSIQLVNEDKMSNSQNNDSWVSNESIQTKNLNDMTQTISNDYTESDESLSFQDLQKMSDSVLDSSLIKASAMNFNTSDSREITSKEILNCNKKNSDINTYKQVASTNEYALLPGSFVDDKENVLRTKVTDDKQIIPGTIQPLNNNKHIADRKLDFSSTNNKCEVNDKNLNVIPVLESTPIKTSNENEMNAEASEPVYNRLLPTNHFKSSMPKERDNESNFYDNNSYQCLIQKRIQEISDILKSNHATCDNDINSKSSLYNSNGENPRLNNEIQTDSSNIIPLLQTTRDNQLFEPLPNKVKDLPRFQPRDKLENTNLNLYKTRINIPEGLDRRPLKSAYNGNDNDILRSSNTARNKLKTAQKHTSNNLLNSLSPIDQFSDVLKSRAEESIRNVQDAFESTLKLPNSNKEIFGKDHFAKDLLEDLSRKHSDIDNKLQSWHLDLNDKLHSFHQKFDKSSNTPTYNNLSGSDSNNVPVRQNNDKLKKITPLLDKNDLNSMKLTPYRPINKKHQFEELPKYFEDLKNNNEVKEFFRDIPGKVRNIPNSLRDKTNRLYGHKDILGSDKNLRLPENHKLKNPLLFTTSRPNPIELLKKHHKNPSQGSIFPPQLHSKPPQLLRSRNKPNLNFNEQSPLASEIVPTRTRISEDIASKKPTFHNFRDLSTLSSPEQKNTMPNNAVNSQYIPLQPPKLPFKLKTERAKMIEKHKANPVNTIEPSSNSVKSVMEEPLKENVSYKCKMVCYKDQ